MTRRDAVTLNLDLIQMGLGAETCWKDWPRDEFRIPANKPYTYSFCLRPFNAKTGDIKKLARRTFQTLDKSDEKVPMAGKGAGE